MSDRAILTHLTATMAVLAVFTGCSGSPDPLSDVRARTAAASANDAIRLHAAGPLAEAQRTLALAADADKEQDRDHLTYLTEKNLDIADAVVARRLAERELEALRRERTAARGLQPDRSIMPGAVEARPIDGRSRQGQQAAAPEPQAGERSSALVPQPEQRTKPSESMGGTVLTIPDVSFDSGTATLSPGAKRRLDGLAGALRADPSLRVLIEGHTDNVGRHEVNLEMSLSRANAVKGYLTVQGVVADRIQTLALGANFPIASNETQEGRWRNRRVEIALYRSAPVPDQNARLPETRADPVEPDAPTSYRGQTSTQQK